MGQCISHCIYEAVLKLKKEVCEAAVSSSGMGDTGIEIDNQAANGAEAGWRYDPEDSVMSGSQGGDTIERRN